MANFLNEEQVQMLRTLANRWMMLARDYDRDSKSPKIDAEKAAYQHGLSEAFRKTALELANVLKSADVTTTGELSAVSASPEDAPTLRVASGQATATISFAPIDQTEAIRFLTFAGATPRDVTVRKDNTILAVFSKMQPLADAERLNLIRGADKRVVIISSGKTREQRDPYVEFGFRT